MDKLIETELNIINDFSDIPLTPNQRHTIKNAMERLIRKVKGESDKLDIARNISDLSNMSREELRGVGL